jgi:hypothetical protein
MHLTLYLRQAELVVHQEPEPVLQVQVGPIYRSLAIMLPSETADDMDELFERPPDFDATEQDGSQLPTETSQTLPSKRRGIMSFFAPLTGRVTSSVAQPAKATPPVPSDDPSQATKRTNVVTAVKIADWKVKFPWFHEEGFEDDVGIKSTVTGKCKVCSLYRPDKCAFSKASGSVVRDNGELERHNNSDNHKKAMSMKKMESIETGVAKMTTVMGACSYPMLLCALFLLSHHVALSSFGPAMQMMAAAGVAGLSVRSKFSNLRYVWRCLFALSETMLGAQMSAAKNSPFFGLACDTSMDLTAEDHLIVVIRYLDTKTMEAKTQYLCTVDLHEKNAQAIASTLLCALKALGLDIRNLVSFAADGDATMMGRWKGVAALLAKEAPHLLATHCVAHRTALLMTDASKKVQALSDVDKCLLLAHRLFAKSSKKTNAWVKHAKPMGVTQLRFPVFNHTRWFSRMQCLSVLTRNLGVLLLFLRGYTKRSRAENWAAGVSAYAELSDVHAAAMLFLLQDVVDPIEKLSKHFQVASILPHHVPALVKTAISSLQVIVDSDGLACLPNVQSFLTCLTTQHVWKLCIEGKEVRLKLSGSLHKDKLVAFKVTLADRLLQSLKDRFEDIDLLCAFVVFDPDSYKNLTVGDLDKFGRDEMSLLCVKFEKVLGLSGRSDYRKVYSQFVAMKRSMLSKCKEPGCTLHSIWSHWQHHEGIVAFPLMLTMVHIMLVIMVHSADVERMFSLARVTKHRLTNSLKVQTLDSLMRIKTLSPKPFHSYDFAAAGLVHAQQLFPLLDGLFKACKMTEVPVSDTNNDADLCDIYATSDGEDEDCDEEASPSGDVDDLDTFSDDVDDLDTFSDDDDDCLAEVDEVDEWVAKMESNKRLKMM